MIFMWPPLMKRVSALSMMSEQQASQIAARSRKPARIEQEQTEETEKEIKISVLSVPSC
jgi:hypothetical protein